MPGFMFSFFILLCTYMYYTSMCTVMFCIYKIDTKNHVKHPAYAIYYPVVLKMNSTICSPEIRKTMLENLI